MCFPNVVGGGQDGAGTGQVGILPESRSVEGMHDGAAVRGGLGWGDVGSGTGFGRRRAGLRSRFSRGEAAACRSGGGLSDILAR